jgi:anti-anti-sigma factor
MSNLPLWRQLRWWLIASFICLAIAPLMVVVLSAYRQVREQTTVQIINQLEATAELKQRQIEQWIMAGQSALAFGLNDSLARQVTALAQVPGSDDEAELNEQLAATLHNTASEDDTSFFGALFIYDPTGRVLAASDPALVGRMVGRQPYFAASLEQPQTQPPYYAVGSGELTMIQTRPIVAPSGQSVGVLAGQLDLQALGSIMLDRSGLADNGETYLVSQENNYLLTPSRYAGYSLNRAYHSEGIDAALSGTNGSRLYSDYREPAVPVIGAYRWVPGLQAALLAEVDQAEIDRQFARTAQLTGIIALGAVLLAAALGYLAATRIARPISELTHTATQIADGDLSQRVAGGAPNEIGALSHAFNHMADQLQSTLGGLEQRIAERTAELEQSNVEQQRVLAELRTSLHERDMLSATIRDLSSPVLPLANGVLAMPLIGVIDTTRAQQIQESLLTAIERHRAHTVLIDVTGVPLIDTQVAQVLLRAASATRLLGARPVLVGIRPELAQTIVGLGLDLTHLDTQPDLQAGIRLTLM